MFRQAIIRKRRVRNRLYLCPEEDKRLLLFDSQATYAPTGDVVAAVELDFAFRKFWFFPPYE